MSALWQLAWPQVRLRDGAGRDARRNSVSAASPSLQLLHQQGGARDPGALDVVDALDARGEGYAQSGQETLWVQRQPREVCAFAMGIAGVGVAAAPELLRLQGRLSVRQSVHERQELRSRGEMRREEAGGRFS